MLGVMDACQDCGNPYPFLQDAHVVARHKGGSDDSSNIIRLCPNCHFIRDRPERIEWLKKRWSGMTPEERSTLAKVRYDAMPEDAKKARGRKISASKTGKKHPVGHKTGGARVLTSEQLEKRAVSVRAFYARWTPEQRAAHSAKIRAAKASSKALT